jgi:ribosomal protein S27AE
MFMPVAPTKVTCQTCGWSKVLPQQGDVVFSPMRCGRCGGIQLDRHSAGVLDMLNPITLIQNMLKK